jgi:hypothetical protein
LPLHGDDFNDDLRRGAKAARRASSEPWMRSIVGEAAYQVLHSGRRNEGGPSLQNTIRARLSYLPVQGAMLSKGPFPHNPAQHLRGGL